MKRDSSRVLIGQMFILVIIIMCAGTVLAAKDFEVNSSSIISRITPEDVAAYNITITNYNESERIYALRLGSGDVTGWILSPNSIKVGPNSATSEVVNIFPKSNTPVGAYSITVEVSYNGESETESLPLYMNFEGLYLDFTPNVALSVSTADVVDPRETMRVSMLTRNRNMLDMKNVTLRIRSDMFYRETNFTLGPRKEITNEMLIDLDPLQAPGVYTIYAELYYPVTDKVVGESQTEFKIDSYSTTNVKTETSKALFIRKDILTVENLGNYERTKDVTMRVPWIKRMFVSSDSPPEYVRVDGKSYLQWNPSLKPMEVRTITITTNYRPLILILLVLIVAGILYFMLRSPLIVLKEASVVEQDDHGISEIKVKVFIKNRSRKALEQITVTDKVPGITEYVESNNLGSMKPSRMTKTTAKGTILHWDLDKLDAFEERIITYKLRSKLKFVGDMALSKTRVKFTYGTGKSERFAISPQPLFFNRMD